MALLKMENVSFTYTSANQSCLSKINLEVNKGEIVLLTGGVASGKSTLLRLLKKELQPTGQILGEITYGDIPLDKLDGNVSATEIGFVQQDPTNQIVTNKVWSELAFGLENLNLPTEEIRSRVGEIAHYFGINHWFHQETQTLSLGQKQLLNLASTVILQPKILILDEPTAHLDPIAATEFIQRLIKLNEELQLTIIIVEHQLEELLQVANRVVILKKGVILLNESPQELTLDLIKDELSVFPAWLSIYGLLEKGNSKVPLSLKEGSKYLSSNFTGNAKLVFDQETAGGEEVVTLKKVSYRYEREGEDVLANLELVLRTGEVFALVGSNGVGKSTLLKVIARILPLQQGKIKLFGKKITKRNQVALQNEIAYLPQTVKSLFLAETLLEDLKIYSHYLNLTELEFQEKLHHVSELFQLADILPLPLSDLSGGQLQLAALAKILFLDSKLVLLDEPSKNLDYQSKANLKKLIKKMALQGKTVLIVTHDLDFAAEIANRCGMFFQGEIIMPKTPRSFFQEHFLYTTTTHRLGRHLYPNAITPEELIQLCLAERNDNNEAR